MGYITYIQDEDHYKKVIEKVASVKKSLWIGTADIKDLHVKSGKNSEPFLLVLADLLKREWRFVLSMLRNRVQSSVRSSIVILYWQRDWKDPFARVCTLK